MAKKNLYGNIGTWYNPNSGKKHYSSELQSPRQEAQEKKELKSQGYIYFGSQLELGFFLYALDFIPLQCIDCHPQITLVPSQPSKKVRAITWKVDFKFSNTIEHDLFHFPFYVETKGFETESFRLKYALFHYLDMGSLILIKSTKDYKLIQDFIKKR